MRDLPGNPHAAERLRRLVQAGRVGHAYLFAGPDGVGKRTLALEFANLLVASTYRHVLTLQPAEGKVSIAVDQVRRLQEWLSLKADHRRAVLIEPADAMTEESQNALLKILEEPPPGVVFLLVTAAPAGLAPTIRSRCQTVLFFPVPDNALRAWIRQHHGLEAGADLDLVAAIAAGSLARANAACQSLHEEKARLERLFKALSTADLSGLVEKVDRTEAQAILRLLAAALRDRLGGRDTALARLVPDGVDALHGLEEVLEHEIQLGLNAHPGLILENALLRVAP